MMTNDLWNFASTPSTSNYVWPSGFTPEGQPSVSSTMSLQGQGQGQGNTMNPLQLPHQQQQQQLRFQEPTIGHFMNNTSPNTDMRLLNALESGAAYIEGNPAEDEDIELFYYRMVSSPCCYAADDSLAQQQFILESIVYPSNFKREMDLLEPLPNLNPTLIHFAQPLQPTYSIQVVYHMPISIYPCSIYSSNTCHNISHRYQDRG